MIDESLLFQMGYLFPDITTMDVVISFFVATVLAFYFFGKPLSPRKKIIYTLPSIESDNFEMELARYIREQIAHEYSPHRSYAHTRKEMMDYISSDSRGEILMLLETSEYQSLPLDPEERKKILETLKKSSRK